MKRSGIKLTVIAPDTEHNRLAIIRAMEMMALEGVEGCGYGPYARFEQVQVVGDFRFDPVKGTKND